MWNKLILKILLQALPMISPALKQLLCSVSKQLVDAAKKTDNPIDDILAGIVQDILCPED